MAGKPQWTSSREDGVVTIHLTRWRWFPNYVAKRLQNLPDYVFRGQASEKWKLESTLDRVLRKRGLKHDELVRQGHLEAFQLATRGRRGPNPPLLSKENDWWALGQHHGLATPLLDWTTSPYVAAYFSFCMHENGGSGRRAVYALQQKVVEEYCEGSVHITGLKEPVSTPDEEPLPEDERLVAFVPRSDENPRLVNQGGLFTRSPDGVDIEAWIRRHFKGVERGILVKITIPDADRDECLTSLNRMNINHLSLFPDLYGTSKFCNTRLMIDGY
jgi:hypothetical protein